MEYCNPIPTGMTGRTVGVEWEISAATLAARFSEVKNSGLNRLQSLLIFRKLAPMPPKT
jgi:hypothetical protein